MPLPFRLAAIDLDETLLGPEKRISEENASAVQDLIDLGVQVVLASGRRYENMIRYAERLGLTGAIITCQGALALEMGTGIPIYESYLRPEHAARVIEKGLSRSLTLIRYHMEATYANRRDHNTDLYDRRSGESGVVVTQFDSLTGSVLKVIWLDEPENIPEHARWAAEHLAEVHSVATDPEYLELMDWNANKGLALEAVATSLGIPQEEVVAFGDGNNDASMLRWAGLGVAMPHGTEIAKTAADQIGPEGGADTALATSIRALLRGGSPWDLSDV